MNPSLRALFISNSIFVFASSLLGPLYAIYVAGIDRAVISVSISWAVFLLISTLVTYIVSRFGDKIKEKEYLLLLGYLIRLISWIAYIFVNNIFSLLLVQLIIGIGEGFGTPAFDAILAEHLDKGKYIQEYSRWIIIRNISIAIATIIGGLIVSRYGFTPLFIIMSVLALISSIYVLIQPRKLL